MVYYEIKTEDIRSNIRVIQKTAEVPVWGVLKYDGYGIGMLSMAELLRAEGVSRFAVSDTVVLVSLRKAGFVSEKVLLLSPQPTEDEINTIIDNNGTFSVGSLAYAKKINDAAAAKQTKAEVHVAVDTGMGRFGFFPGSYGDIAKLYTAFDNISVTGIFTHLSSAFLSKTDMVRVQFDTFKSILNRLSGDGIDRGMAHIANSPALFRFPEMRLDAVRTGSALVGRVSGVNAGKSGLTRVGCLVVTVAEIKEYPKGRHIGYGNGFKAKKSFTGAVLSAGQWAGIPARGMRETIMGKYPTADIGGRAASIVCASGEGHSVLDITGMNVSVGDLVRIDINPLKLNSAVEKHYI